MRWRVNRLLEREREHNREGTDRDRETDTQRATAIDNVCRPKDNKQRS